MRRLIAFAAGILMLVGTAGAGPIDPEITMNNFQSRLQQVVRVSIPTANVPVEETDRMTTEQYGMDQVTLTVGGSQIEVRSSGGPDTPVDYLNIFADAEDAASIARLIELTPLTAVALGATDAQAEDLRKRLIGAAKRGKAFRRTYGPMKFEFNTESPGAFFSVFTGRD